MTTHPYDLPPMLTAHPGNPTGPALPKRTTTAQRLLRVHVHRQRNRRQKAEMIRRVPLPPTRLWLMIMAVWVNSWQMQCCGDPFRRGSKVAWTLRDVDSDWFDAMLARACGEPWMQQRTPRRSP